MTKGKEEVNLIRMYPSYNAGSKKKSLQKAIRRSLSGLVMKRNYKKFKIRSNSDKGFVSLFLTVFVRTLLRSQLGGRNK